VGNAAVGGAIIALRDTICEGTPGSLTLTGNTSNTIQWQSSLNDTTFTNLVNDTLAGYKTIPLMKTTLYRVLVGTGSCSAISDTLQLYVPPPLTAYFNATQPSGSTLAFNSDSSSGSIRSYHWDFGDNSASTDKNPSHTYTKDTTYYVCLTLYDGSNCSYTFCRYSEVTDGVPFISASGNWIIYPNPFSSQLTITGKQINSRVQSIELYDVLGRLVINRNTDTENNKLNMDASFLANGMYFLMIKTADENYVQKVIKQ
jgi:PKD repeat protein